MRSALWTASSGFLGIRREIRRVEAATDDDNNKNNNNNDDDDDDDNMDDETVLTVSPRIASARLGAAGGPVRGRIRPPARTG